ncbi:MAG: hypothetical protein M1610_01230 [Nitrospirae bacterium]|nr:hypothetical protein [Nitrospirota bacterium]MDA8338036.1 hypothetical protein [Nitrospiraceae bacterium]
MKRLVLIILLIALASCSKQVKEPEVTSEWKLIKSQQEVLTQKKKMLSEISSTPISEMYDIAYIGYALGDIGISDAQAIFKVKIDLNRRFWKRYFKTLGHIQESQGIEVCANYKIERVRGYNERVRLKGTKYYLHPDLKPYIIQPKKAYIVVTINGIDFRVQTVLHERFYNLSSITFPNCVETRGKDSVIGDDGMLLSLSLNINPELLKHEPKVSVRMEEL